MSKSLSRQRQQQIKWRDAGRCQRCGCELNLYPTCCDKCAMYHR